MILVGSSKQRYPIADYVAAGILKPFNSRSLQSISTGNIYINFMRRSFVNGGASMVYIIKSVNF